MEDLPLPQPKPATLLPALNKVGEFYGKLLNRETNPMHRLLILVLMAQHAAVIELLQNQVTAGS